MNDFKLTVGITSCNRLKYLRALVNSLDDVLDNDVQLIIVDNGSTEAGLVEYLNALKKVDKLVLRKERNWINDEYIAKNIIIEHSKSPFILFLQDDFQFIANKETLMNYVNAFSKMQEQNLDMSGVRKSTLSTVINRNEKMIYNDAIFWHTNNDHFSTTGLFKKETFTNNGLYPTDWPQEQAFWGRSEDYYHELLRKTTNKHLTVKSHVPLFLTVWNDPRGGYAFIRGDYRYGVYESPSSVSGIYYKKLNVEEIDSYMNYDEPVGTVDIAKPLNWSLPTGKDGDLLKYPQLKILEEGPRDPLDLAKQLELEKNEDYIDNWLNE
jgi:glycosyltransferase involved in cell wall biosynthesis